MFGIIIDPFYDFSIRLWWKCSDRWYLFFKVSILTFSVIFLMDCGGNFQTGWYLFVRVSILTFLRFFYWIVVEMFREGAICLLGYQFCFFLRFFY